MRKRNFTNYHMINMRLTFNKVCEILYKAYGKEDISQIRKPDHKPFYVVDFEDGHGKHLYRDDIIRLTM